MKSGLPLVSIIITSYNRAHMVAKAIESALAQDYPNLEIIISDNCSTDGSDDVIKKYVNDPRIRYSRNAENIGMLPNFRKATYELSRGEYIAYVNSDDYLVNNTFITDAVNLIINYPDIRLVFGRMAFNNTSNGVVWEMPVHPYFTSEIREGKDIFFTSTTSFLLSWGACVMNKHAMLEVQSLQQDYYNGDIDSNYKIMTEGKVGFLNKLCYMQIGHEDNHGFPADSGKIIHSMECYKNVARYAMEKWPDDRQMVKGWEQHYLYHTVKWALHTLHRKDKKQYHQFKDAAKKYYPEEYSRFFRSKSYLSLLLQPLKKIVPAGVIKFVGRTRKQ